MNVQWPIILWRCPHCRNLLLKARLPPGAWLEIKCPKCRQIVVRGEDSRLAA